jgi:hypothetical protein
VTQLAPPSDASDGEIDLLFQIPPDSSDFEPASNTRPSENPDWDASVDLGLLELLESSPSESIIDEMVKELSRVQFDVAGSTGPRRSS